MSRRGPKGPNRTSIKPGEVRNPTGNNGRKKAALELKAQLEEFLSETVQDKTRWAWLLSAWYKAALEGSAPHLAMLLDRVYGKPKEQIEVSGPEGDSIRIDWSDKTDDELRAIIAAERERRTSK